VVTARCEFSNEEVDQTSPNTESRSKVEISSTDYNNDSDEDSSQPAFSHILWRY
jgi:hypothetical protein